MNKQFNFFIISDPGCLPTDYIAILSGITQVQPDSQRAQRAGRKGSEEASGRRWCWQITNYFFLITFYYFEGECGVGPNWRGGRDGTIPAQSRHESNVQRAIVVASDSGHVHDAVPAAKRNQRRWVQWPKNLQFYWCRVTFYIKIFRSLICSTIFILIVSCFFNL